MAADRIRLVDVAARAGVTSTTASLALNGKPGVSEAVREKIVRLAREIRQGPAVATR